MRSGTGGLLRFRYGGFEASVRTSDPATVAWLAEFYAPWFEAEASDEAPAVDLRIGPDEVERVLADSAPTDETVECFTMDGAHAPWHLRRAADGTAVAWEPELRVALGPRAGTVEIVAGKERPYGRLALLRVLRELAGTDAARRGQLGLHAAAVERAGGVTLFVGGKGSGKSTLLLHALRDLGTRYVSNDRVYAAGTEVRGMPTVISLREGSLAEVPGLREELASGAWHHASTLAEVFSYRVAGTHAPGSRLRWPPGLSAAQLCALLGTEALAGGTVARIVFPRIADGADAPERFELAPLSADEAGARLQRDGLLADGRTAQFLAQAPPADPGLAHALGASVPCFDCRLGPSAYASPSVWEALRA